MPAPGALARPSAAYCHCHRMGHRPRPPPDTPSMCGGSEHFPTTPSGGLYHPHFPAETATLENGGILPKLPPEVSGGAETQTASPGDPHASPEVFNAQPGPGPRPLSPGSGHPGPPLFSLDVSPKLLPSTVALWPGHRSSRPQVELPCVFEGNGGEGSAWATGAQDPAGVLLKCRCCWGPGRGWSSRTPTQLPAEASGLPSQL